jgi:LPS export ABC transporter permease LptF/LPS export ABC transporter permease LptG
LNALRLLRPTLIDWYVVAEILPPTGLGLVLFSFILLLQHITQLTAILISRGADLPTIVEIFLNLMPSILATTVPMAFLLGVLLAFGRLASDCEIVALRASGVSASRLLRPVVLLSFITGAVTFYIMSVALPAANQAFREVFYSLVVSKARSGLKPRVFTDDLVPGMVLYISDISAQTGQWSDVFVHDAREPLKPRVILARSGRLVIDKDRRSVELHLQKGVRYTFAQARPEVYDQDHFRSAAFPLPFDQIFPKVPLAKGDRELTLAELSAKIRELRRQGRTRRDTAPFEVEWHKKFAIPAACLVFGLLGLGLSLGSKKEARSAAFGISIAVIFVYYVFIRLGEQGGDTGLLPPLVAMWGANAVLGGVAVVLLALNQREAGFDPLDPSHYTSWLPRLRRARPAPPRTSSSSRVVVVLKLPRPSVPLPSLLDRYVARTLAGHFALVLAGFWAIFLLAHFMDLFDDIQQNRVKGSVVLHYYAFYSPHIVQLVMPVAGLVTVLVTFGVMGRRNEITAMKAGGISVYRATLPSLVMGALGSAFLLLLGEFVLPYTNRIAQMDFNVIRGRPPQSSSPLERRWILGSDGRIYNYDYLVEVARFEAGAAAEGRRRDITLYGLSVYDIDPAGWDLSDRLYAARAVWDPYRGGYDLERGWRLSFRRQPPFRTFETARTREIEPPSYFRREQPESDSLRYQELSDHIAALEKLGLDVTTLKVQLHRKLAFPAVSVVIALIGIPFAFTVGRRGALYGIGISIVIAIVYWACLGIFEALGNNALLPPLLAAWAPNVVFALVGLYMMLTLET